MMENSMDADLTAFQAMARGDHKSFENLFRKYYSDLCSYALTYLEGRDEAEDAVQDVFVYLWDNREVIVLESSVKSYLYSAVKHRALNMLKHKIVERNHSRRLVEYLEEMAQEAYSEEEEKQLERIRQALDGLPEQCRNIFARSALDGKKYKEIAEEYHISINTVKTQILRAYRAIRKSVDDASSPLMLVVIFRYIEKKLRKY